MRDLSNFYTPEKRHKGAYVAEVDAYYGKDGLLHNAKGELYAPGRYITSDLKNYFDYEPEALVPRQERSPLADGPFYTPSTTHDGLPVIEEDAYVGEDDLIYNAKGELYAPGAYVSSDLKDWIIYEPAELMYGYLEDYDDDLSEEDEEIDRMTVEVG